MLALMAYRRSYARSLVHGRGQQQQQQQRRRQQRRRRRRQRRRRQQRPTCTHSDCKKKKKERNRVGERGDGREVEKPATRLEERGEQNDRGMKRETHAIYIPHRHRSLCNERRKGARPIPLQVVEKSRRSERTPVNRRREERVREEEASSRHLRCKQETSKKRTRANHERKAKERKRE